MQSHKNIHTLRQYCLRLIINQLMLHLVHLSVDLLNYEEDYCLVTFIERDIFAEVDQDGIIEILMAFRHRKPDKRRETVTLIGI